MVQGILKGRFVVRVEGGLKTYTDYNEIPSIIEDIISFEPDVPTGPHTPEEHAAIEHWQYRLQLLMRRAG
ncbi:MAG: hypothetical protein CL918_01625 [Deltaproteobacteria bacterium]|nr:hypothetical protein [Deltaproteobacteria bacterium]|tara:strand:- start:251 stop:460 length:210 start_codon:yes stop_codon:yes gene_type:complete